MEEPPLKADEFKESRFEGDNLSSVLGMLS